MNLVAISREEDIEKSIKAIFEFLKEDIKIDNGYNIAIKINMCDLRPPETGATTDPIVLKALVEYLQLHYSGLDIVLVESDSTTAWADLLYKWLKFDRIEKDCNIRFQNLSEDNFILKKIDGYYLKEIKVPRTLEEKNQYGCLTDKYKSKYHKHLDEVIADINLVMRPDFSLVDGIIAMDGWGPVFGSPKKANILIAGCDPVAVDSVCARIMGFHSVKHIRLAAKKGVGSMKYKTVGLSLNDLDINFKHNMLEYWYINAVEILARRAASKKGE
jgi:uncharacterized protein (DUF362 family)